MATRSRSIRQEQLELVSTLREQRASWPIIARALSEQYGVNMRVAFRLAHGWSQREAADRWNQRWPAEPKTFKNLSYWENWPSKTGYEPSLDVLARLAELYECSASDLLSDYADYSPQDTAGSNPVRFNHQTRTGFVLPFDKASKSASEFEELVASPEDFDIHELAAACSQWARGLSGELDRRDLLLKLSAALTLAAATPILASAHESPPRPLPARGTGRLSGIWHSRYSFPSSGRAAQVEGEHYVVIKERDGRLTGQSLPHSRDSRLHLDLIIDGSVITGTWSEQTAPTGYYKGATYHGALQVLLDPRGRTMTGKWLGFDKEFRINAGDWSLTWVDGSTSPRAMREYHLKV